jgi:DNA-binding transcriptional ArsR family regulator
MSQPQFKALADPTRRDILRLLSQQEMTIAQVCDHFTMTRAAVKKHLSVLEAGGLISSHARGRECLNRFEPAGFAPVRDWIGFFDQFWDHHLSALHSAIEKDQSDDPDRDQNKD